ncbi:MAG: triose-phosphate isomerase [candidate division Zixibacteria bacterium]|nr:triose-phosphate isomerase [candidate division Zixibacteria bacterium]
MARTPLIAGNWKMHTTAEEARALARAVRDGAAGVGDVEVVVCPPFTALAAVADELAASAVKLGAQNVFYEEMGAFTGEVSPPMLTALGVEYVIVGHSERRQYFHETDDVVNKKVRAALAHGLKPIICVGEKLEEREAGDGWKDLVRGQVKAALAGVSVAHAAKAAVAYEPVWAIGTGRTATPAAAAEAHALLREVVSGTFGRETAELFRILYGGSVNPENVKELMAEPDVDGALVGGASLKAESFVAIMHFGE